MKPNSENLPDLEAAFEAVKGVLFGPLDPALAKQKHKELIADAKEKREQGVNPHGRLGLPSDDRTERDRKERDQQTRTLTWLLANDQAYREAHERAMASIDEAARAIEAGERASDALRQRMEDYLASTPRLKDGRYVMVDKHGNYWDQDCRAVRPEDAAEVDGQPKRAFKPFEHMLEHKTQIDRDLAELRGWDVEVGGMKNELTDEEHAADPDRVKDIAERTDDFAKRAEEKIRGFERSTPTAMADRERMIEEQANPTATATMAMPSF